MGHGGGDCHVVQRDAAAELFFPASGSTFTIADPQNWVALGAFLITSIVGSQLSARIRREATRPITGGASGAIVCLQREFSGRQRHPVDDAIPNHIVECFDEAGAAGTIRAAKGQVYRSG